MLESFEKLDELAHATGLPLVDVVDTHEWVSVDRPHLRLNPEDVERCETCGDGHRDCPDCRGEGFVHGYDANLIGLPARMVVR